MTAGLVRIEAPAKLNLRLLVGAVRADGYHPVESLVVTLTGLADTVTLTPAANRRVRCRGVAERENLAWKALDALERRIGRALQCAVEIDKRIPSQAGLGGGSSDAAATLVGANRLFELGLDDAELEHVGAEVGSDVPLFVRGGAQWASGRGEILRPAAAPAFGAVIVKPPFGLSTPSVYSAFDALPPPAPPAEGALPTDFAELVAWVRNDLTDAARSCRPALAASFSALMDAGAAVALLCGSGTAVAGLFPTHAHAQRAASACPDLVAVVSYGDPPGGDHAR